MPDMVSCPLCRGVFFPQASVLGATIEHVRRDCIVDRKFRIRWLLDEAYMQLRPVDEPSRTCIDGALDLLHELAGPIR